MVSVKRSAALVFFLITLLISISPVLAADLTVKENRTKSGIVNVALPTISGAVGGKQVDAAVNRAVLSYVNSQMKQILSEQEASAFDVSHKEGDALNDRLRYNSDLVRYTDKVISGKNETGRVTASWYVRNEYEIKTAKDKFFSVILKTKTYTGGPRDSIEWKTLNFDLQDGHLLELKDLFMPEAEYAVRLQTLIGYQQLGRVRLIRHIKGKDVADPKPVTISGGEDFYVDDHYNLGVIIRSGNAEEGPVKLETYDISLNDFADLIKL